MDRDKQMIDDPDRWPNLRLPLKRGSNHPMELGWLFAPLQGWQDEKREVHIGNIFASEHNNEVIMYDSTDDLLTDGWRVD